jgi:hypothetical protein
MAGDGTPAPTPNATWMPIINLGLPRTGTSSLAIAAAMSGLYVAHAWCDTEPELLRLGHILRDPELAQREAGGRTTPTSCRHAGTGQYLWPTKYDFFSDMPYSILQPSVLLKRVPGATFVCSTRRSRDAWVQSMRSHGSAGGYVLRQFIIDVAKRFANATIRRLASSGRPTYPWGNMTAKGPVSWHDGTDDVLGAFYDWHLRSQCDGHPRINVDAMPSTVKWNVLCGAMAPAPSGAGLTDTLGARGGGGRLNGRRRGCEAARLASGGCWPSTNLRNAHAHGAKGTGQEGAGTPGADATAGSERTCAVPFRTACHRGSVHELVPSLSRHAQGAIEAGGRLDGAIEKLKGPHVCNLSWHARAPRLHR